MEDSNAAILSLRRIDGYDDSRISGSERWTVGFSAAGVLDLAENFSSVVDQTTRGDLQGVGITDWESPPQTGCIGDDDDGSSAPSPRPPSPQPPSQGEEPKGMLDGLSSKEKGVLVAGGVAVAGILIAAIAS